jgi:hypothetical protein
MQQEAVVVVLLYRMPSVYRAETALEPGPR